MSFRPTSFFVPSSTELKIFFSQIVSESIGVENFYVESVSGSGSDLEILSILVDQKTVIIKTRPQAPNNYYMLKMLDTDKQLFESFNGEYLINDDVSRTIFFIGVTNVNRVRDDIISKMPQVYSLDGTLISNVISNIADEILKSQHDIGQVLNSNYLKITTQEEQRTRGSDAYDRLANENAYEVLSVSKFRSSNNIFNNQVFISSANSYPLNIREVFVENEEISSTTSLNNFDGFLLTLSNNFITRISSIKVVRYLDEENCSGEIGEFYNIQKYGYSILDNRFDQQNAFVYFNLKSNQALLSEFGNLDRFGSRDKVYVSYYYEDKSIKINEETVTVYSKISKLNEVIPSNSSRFFLKNAPIIDSSGAVANIGGVQFKISENSEDVPFEFSNELPFNLSRLPKLYGEYSINYSTGEVFLVGKDKDNIGTGYNNYFVNYTYKKLWLNNLDYFSNEREINFNQNRSAIGKSIFIDYTYNSVLSPGSDYNALTHSEVLGELVENRFTSSFSFKTLKPQITDVFRVSNVTTGEVYSVLYNNENEVFISGRNLPRISSATEENSNFKREFNESLSVSGEMIAPVHKAKIKSNGSNLAIEFNPPIPAEFLNSSTTYYLRTTVDSSGNEIQVSDLKINYFHSQDSNGNISKLAISLLDDAPSVGSEIYIGPNVYFFNLKNNLILNKELSAIGSFLSSSIYFSDELFLREKFFDKLTSKKSLKMTTAGSMFFTIDSDSTDILYKNIARLRQYGDFAVDYFNGVIYVVANQDTPYACGSINYAHSEHITTNNNVLSINSVVRKNKLSDGNAGNLIPYESFTNNISSIKILDLERSLDIYDGTIVDNTYGEEKEALFVYDNYTAYTKHNISSIYTINKSKDIFGKNLSYIDGESRELESDSSSLTLSALEYGKNYFDKNYISFNGNIIDFKKSFLYKTSFTGYSLTINVKDDQIVDIYNIVDYNTGLEIMSPGQIILIESEILSTSISEIDPETLDVYYSEILSGYSFNADFDYIVDIDNNKFKITNFDELSQKFTINKFAENDETIQFESDYFSLVSIPQITILDGKIEILYPRNITTEKSSRIKINYLTSLSIEPGTAIAVDYNYGNITFDYSYIVDTVQVWYEYGDNSIDWSINNSVLEGETYYVTYNYGALRSALRKNFGSITGIPKLKTLSLNMNREVYRDFLIGVLQSFPKGPTIPAISGLVQSVTKTKPEITESFFGDWVLGRDYLDTSSVNLSGNLTFEPVKHNEGLLLGDGATLSIPAISNLPLNEGTIEFWMKPLWNGINNDATLTFNFENVGTSIISFLGGENPFQKKYSFDILNNTDSGNFGTDSSSGKLTIFKNLVSEEDYYEGFLEQNFSVVNKKFNITRLNNTRLSFDIKQNYLHKGIFEPYLGFDSKKFLPGGFVLIPDGYKGILLELGYISRLDELNIYVDSEISSDEIPSFGFPFKTKNCRCSSTPGLSILNNFAELEFDITFSDVVAKEELLYADSNIMSTVESLSIVDQDGRIYNVTGLVDSNDIVQRKTIPDQILGIKVSRYPENYKSLSAKEASEINAIQVTSFIILNKALRTRNNIEDVETDKSSIYYGSPATICLNWSNFTSISINRISKDDNLVKLNINNFIFNYFYTDFNSILQIQESIDNLDENKFMFGVLSASSIDIRKIRFEIDHKYSIEDIYIGASSINPRSKTFSLSRLDDNINSIGISQKIDTSEGIFIGYDQNCSTPFREDVGQWLVKVRNDRFMPLPVDVELGTSGFENIYDLFEINETLIGDITTDGDFSSVSRGRRLVGGSCQNDSSDCYGSYRYCAERILSEGWNKVENITIGETSVLSQLNIAKWRKVGVFDESLQSTSLRLDNFSEKDSLLSDGFGIGMLTDHQCNMGVSSISINIKVNSIDPNIVNLGLNTINDTNFDYSGITPILFSSDTLSIAICYVINQDGIGAISLINQKEKREITSINFNWFDSEYHNLRMEVLSEDNLVNIYVDDALVLMASIDEFEAEIDQNCTIGNNNYIGFSIIDSNTVDIDQYLEGLSSPSVDINLIELSYEYIEGIAKVENGDILINDNDQKISFEFSSNSNDDIYELDGYQEVSDLDEIFITSDKRRYFVDSGIHSSNSRISIFKDGKGFLNFRIYDSNPGEKNSIYNIASNIKNFSYGEPHHIAASWKLNSHDSADQMHLFIDGYEAPNMYRFGGSIPLKLNAKFADIGEEVLQDYITRNITYHENFDGYVSAGDNKVFSASIIGTEEVISRGILIKNTEDDTSLLGKYFIISGVGPGYFELTTSDGLNEATFDITTNVSFCYPPTTSDSYLIKTDLLNEKFSIKIIDCEQNQYEVGGIETGTVNGIPFVSSGNVSEAYFRWNSTLNIIEFVRYNTGTCLWEESVNNTDINVGIITFGLKTRKVSDLVQISSSTLSYDGNNNLSFIYDKSSSISLIQLTGPRPRSIGDISIKKVFIDYAANESLIYDDGTDKICEFLVSNDEIFGMLTSEQLDKFKVNDGRYLSIRIDSDNVKFCGVDAESLDINYVDVYGDNESGIDHERIYINSNGSFETQNRFYNLSYVSGKFICQDSDYEALHILVSERDSMFVQNGSSTTPIIWRMIDNKLIISELGSESYDPFEIPPGYFRITYGTELSLQLPIVGKDLFIGTDINKKNGASSFFDDFVIRNEMLLDVKTYESSDEYENSITYDFNSRNPICITSNILCLIKFDDPINKQSRFLRNYIFLNELTNEKEKLDTNELEDLIKLVNNRSAFEQKLINMGESKESAQRAWFCTNMAGGGPVQNIADFYPKYNEILLSNSGPNTLFGQSAKFDRNNLSIFNNNSILRGDSGTIEFWISPLVDTVYDSSTRFFFDSYSAIRTSVKSSSSKIIKLQTAASKILSIKLLKDNEEYSSYIPDEKYGVIFDEIKRSEITGVLTGGTGSEKDFSSGCTISADGKTILLEKNLPGSSTEVIINYIPRQLSGQRISIFKDKYSRIIFRIINGDTEYYIPFEVDWDRNSWHRIYFSYAANTKQDFMRAIIDGISSENIYYKETENNDFSEYPEENIVSKLVLTMSEQFSEINIGNNISKDCIALSRIDNFRISKSARKITRDITGSIIDQNYSSNLSSVNPVKEDDLTTILLDFDYENSDETNIATISDPVYGMFNFDINIIDAFDRTKIMNQEYVEDLLVELINRIKPAHTNALVKFENRYCKK